MPTRRGGAGEALPGHAVDSGGDAAAARRDRLVRPCDVCCDVRCVPALRSLARRVTPYSRGDAKGIDAVPLDNHLPSQAAPSGPSGPSGPSEPPAREDDVEVARSVAGAAGRELLRLRADGGPDLRGRGDRGAQAVIAAELARLRPGDAVLSEEAADDPRRLAADRVWIVDPLDGTREFGEGDRHDWAVHVALWQAGDLVAGAVALPALDRTLTTGDAAAPWRAVPLDGRAPRLAVSRSRATGVVTSLADALGFELVPLGSAGYKTSAVVLGEADAYVHTGGQYEWDSAAPVAVARAAGLWTSRADGSPLVYNRADPLLPDLVVCRPELSDAILSHLSRPTERETA